MLQGNLHRSWRHKGDHFCQMDLWSYDLPRTKCILVMARTNRSEDATLMTVLLWQNDPATTVGSTKIGSVESKSAGVADGPVRASVSQLVGMCLANKDRGHQ
jgi:hypothetical protein